MTGRLLITAGTVWDGVAAQPVRDGFVLVEDGRIAAVGRRAELTAPAAGAAVPEFALPELGAPERIDLPAAGIVPGLIDAHVHMALSGSPSPRTDHGAEARSGPAALAVRAVRNLQTAVAAGITTVRDLGVENEVGFALRAAVAAGRLVGPRVLTSGAPLTVTGGHCHWFGIACDTADDVRRAVRRQVRDGADWVKIMVSGGNLTPRTNPLVPQFTAAEVVACVQEATRLRVPVAAHAYDPASIRRAVAAGVRTVEHCLFETGDGFAYDPATAAEMAATGVAFVPTISGAFRRMNHGEDRAVARRYAERQHEIREVFTGLLAAGVGLVAGTDAGVPGRRFGGLPADLAAFVEPGGLGLSPHEALVSATSGSARTLGTDGGVLRPGAPADLLAVDGDPLDDITALTRPVLVLAAGRPVRPVPGIHDAGARHEGARP